MDESPVFCHSGAVKLTAPSRQERQDECVRESGENLFSH